MPSAKFSQSRRLPSANIAKATLALLHDYDRLIQCQPLVGPTEKLSGAPKDIQHQVPESEKSPKHVWYQQTEHIPILPFGLLKKKVVFYNWYKDLPSASASASTPTPAESTREGGAVESNKEEEGGNRVVGGVESICYAPSNIKIYAVFRIEKKKGDSRPDFRNSTIMSRGKGNVATAPTGDNVVHINGFGDGNDVSGVSVQDHDYDNDDDDDEGWSVVEETEMTCSNWLILQFSERQHKAAHEKMLDAIVHQARKSAEVSKSENGTGTGTAMETRPVVQVNGVAVTS